MTFPINADFIDFIILYNTLFLDCVRLMCTKVFHDDEIYLKIQMICEPAANKSYN